MYKNTQKQTKYSYIEILKENKTLNFNYYPIAT